MKCAGLRYRRLVNGCVGVLVGSTSTERPAVTIAIRARMPHSRAERAVRGLVARMDAKDPQERACGAVRGVCSGFRFGAPQTQADSER
jgi:hypothetical protein